MRQTNLITSLLFLRKKVNYFNLVFFYSFKGVASPHVKSQSPLYSVWPLTCVKRALKFVLTVYHLLSKIDFVFPLHFSCSRYPKAIYSNEFQIWIDSGSVGNHVSHCRLKASLHPVLKLKSVSSQDANSPGYTHR